MMNIRILFLTMLYTLTLGCAKGTSVILLEDPDGHVGKVTVSTPAGQATLDRAGTETTVTSSKGTPSEIRTVSQQEITERFDAALNAQPLPVTTFILYFTPGTSELTTESQPLPDAILAKVRERASGDVRINGHTDRVGSREVNTRLSLERAETVRDILIDKGMRPEIIQVFHHGEGNPLIPTADNVAEPRNRRVEVLVR